VKKKQFKRLEHLLQAAFDAKVHGNEQLRLIKGDQRAIAETNAEGGSAILQALTNLTVAVNDVEGHAATDFQSIIGVLGDMSTDTSNAAHGLEQVEQKLVDLHTCLDAWGKVLQHGIDSSAGILSSIDTQMAPVSHHYNITNQVRSGPGIEEFSAASNDLPEPSAPQGPDPTTADSWAGKMGEDITREAVERFEKSVARHNPGIQVIPKAEAEALNTPQPEEVQSRPLTKEEAGFTLSWAVSEWNKTKQENAELRSELSLTRENYASAVEKLGETQTNVFESRQSYGKAQDEYKRSRAQYDSELRAHNETKERLKLALEDLGGHKEGLPKDASVGHFRNWVGNHGFEWIRTHHTQLGEYINRMEREAAYNRGNQGRDGDNIEPPKTSLNPFDS